MRGHHCQNAVLNSVMLNLNSVIQNNHYVRTQLKRVSQNLRQQNKIWGEITKFKTEQNFNITTTEFETTQHNLIKHNKICNCTTKSQTATQNIG